MKSSTILYIVVFTFIGLPILFWATTAGSYDIRGRADEPSTTPTSTPFATPSATLTPTPGNRLPTCSGISVSPNAGSKPLTVNFSCAGYDQDNDITAAEFGFGGDQKRLVEKNIGQFGSISTSYTYTNAGTYRVTCRVRDNNQAFSTYPEYCQYYVYVSENALTPTPRLSPTSTRFPTPPVSDKGTRSAGEPIIYFGNVPTSTPTPAVSPAPTITPIAPRASAWVSSEKIMQLIMMVIVSGVTIIVALLLHGFFDKRA